MARSDFYVGGHVPLGSDAYVERAFVQECFDLLAGGRWVVLLGPRQHGKTSGLVRLAKMLRDANVKCAQLSLQGLPDADSVEALCERICRKIAEQLGVELGFPDAADRGELDAWLAAALPAEAAQTVIILDEAAAIRSDDVRSAFYHQLRRLHDERNAQPVANLGPGLAFLFSGTFEPKRLVADDLASPFNVCRTVETEDLPINAVHDLVERLKAAQAASFVERVFELVGGQPYLLQYLLAEAERGDAVTSAEDRLGSAEEELLAGNSNHLISLFSAVVSDHPIREIVRAIVAHGSAPFVATPEHRTLVVVGFGRRDGTVIVPRNRLYAETAAKHFLLTETAESAAGATIAPPGAGSLDFMTDAGLRGVAEEMLEGGVDSFNQGHTRLGLIGLGSALESILIDVLEQATDAERNAAVNAAQPKLSRNEDQSKPSSWRLVNLIKVADALPLFSSAHLAAAHAIRELRNHVHPALVRESGVTQADLLPEFNAAEAVLALVIREVGP
jgi:hypothetical protein